jgi:hypothetical protein
VKNSEEQRTSVKNSEEQRSSVKNSEEKRPSAKNSEEEWKSVTLKQGATRTDNNKKQWLRLGPCNTHSLVAPALPHESATGA